MSSYRILCIGETWLGSDSLAAFQALRRLSHSVQILDEWHYVSLAWRSTPARAVRKFLRPLFIRELADNACRLALRFKPNALFVFKGNWVHPRVIQFYRDQGIPAVNYYPDVSFMAHGPRIPQALPLYNHVFTTKSYGLRDMKERLGAANASFLAPGYDPDLHRPVLLTQDEQATYGCDAGFIGTWSPKKENILGALHAACPEINLRIWGCQWEGAASRGLGGCVMGDEVTGDEYTKAICGARICLGLLSEARTGSSSGDLITARTFQIPACGAFMLHERNPEVLTYFAEDKEAAYFDTPEELARQVKFYLENSKARASVAQGGRDRSARDDYSIDSRMKTIIHWLDEHYARTR